MSDPGVFNQLGYRLMIGFAGISIGASIALAYHWLKSAIKGESKAYWFWAAAMLGFTLHFLAVFPLILSARQAHAPWTFQVWMFFVGVTLETIAYVGLYIRRVFMHRNLQIPEE